MLAPYSNPYVDNILRLMAVQSQNQADTVRQQGDISAHMWGGIGNTIASTMGDIIKYKMNAPKRELMQQDLTKGRIDIAEKQSDLADRAQIDNAMRASGGDPDTALTILRRSGSGAINAMGKLQTQVVQQRRAGEDDMLKKLDIAHKQTVAVAEQVQGIHSLPLEQRPQAWSDAYPSITAAVGPELAKRIPVAYDERVVGNLLSAGQTLTEHMETRRLALEDAKFARDEAKSDREKDEAFTKSLGGWLSTTGSDEEYQQVLKIARAPRENGGYGVDAKTLAKFDQEWSPEAVKKAEDFSLTASEKNARIIRAGTLEDYMARVARENHTTVDKLTSKDTENATRRWSYARHISDANTMTATERERYVDLVMDNHEAFHTLSRDVQTAIATDLHDRGFTDFGVPRMAQDAVAERWRKGKMDAIEKQFKAGATYDASGALVPAMTKDEYAQEKLNIHNSYLAQMGKDPVDHLPGAKPIAPPPPPPAQGPTPAPTPQPSPTPKPPEPPKPKYDQASAAKFLKGKKPGVYGFEDGTKWMLLSDGSIRPAPGG